MYNNETNPITSQQRTNGTTKEKKAAYGEGTGVHRLPSHTQLL